MPYDPHDSQIRHSFYGRRLGFDGNDFLVGHSGERPPTETRTSTGTVSSTLAKGGTSLLSATAAAVFELEPPSAAMVGVRKRVINTSTAAVSQIVKIASGNFLSVFGSSATTLTMSTRNAMAELEYISTALIAVNNLQSTSTAATVYLLQSTST